MGVPTKPNPVKLIVGCLSCDPLLLQKAENFLSKGSGPIDFKSEISDFDQTDYYNQEMGQGLKRQFFAFERLIAPEQLVAIKLHTNRLEKKWSQVNGRRAINLDPGYISLSKLVLATTKSFAHRIYVGRGIYEEITLIYQNKSFQPTLFTYPDYRLQRNIDIFNKLRDIYYRQIESSYGPSKLPYCV